MDLMRDPSPGQFAEAYVDGSIDLEGDIFRTMTVANAVEAVRVTRRQRLRILPRCSALQHDARRRRGGRRAGRQHRGVAARAGRACGRSCWTPPSSPA